MTNEIKITEGGKIILNTVKDELFPTVNMLKDLIVKIHSCRIRFPLYSAELNKIRNEYESVSVTFFDVAKKLETPDILFANMHDDPQLMVSYFQYKNAFESAINEGVKAVEIIDRSVDRKSQVIQNSWTYLLAVVAIIASIIWG
jgi:hypothetical protein